MPARFMRCQRVRANNGIVDVVFTRAADMPDHSSQEELTQINWLLDPDEFENGETYYIEIRKAAPLKVRNDLPT